jgi:hypothetical protein
MVYRALTTPYQKASALPCPTAANRNAVVQRNMAPPAVFRPQSRGEQMMMGKYQLRKPAIACKKFSHSPALPAGVNAKN